MFNQTITIHNFMRHENESEDTRYTTVLKGVYFLKDESMNLVSPGTVKSDIVTVIIPKKLFQSSKKFIEPYKYDKLSKEDLDKYFTLRNGDFVSLGDVTGEIESFDDYRNDVGNVYEISAVTDNDFGGMANFEVYAN